MLNTKDLAVNITYDEALLNSIISEINSLLPDRIIRPDFYINDSNELIITSGRDGSVVDTPSFRNSLELVLSDFDNDEPTIDIPVILKVVTK